MIPSAWEERVSASPTQRTGRCVDDDGVVELAQVGEDLGEPVGGGELSRVGRERAGDEHVEDACLGDRRAGAVQERGKYRAGLGCADVEVDPLQRVFELDPAECDVGDAFDRAEPEEAVDVGPAEVEVDERDPPARAGLGDGEVRGRRRLALLFERRW